MKIAYFGFDLFFDCLQTIFDNNHEIIKIFTCKVFEPYESNRKVLSFSNEHHIPITDEKVTKFMIEELETAGCELIISAGYYYKIPISEKIIGLNVHPSILPIGRGPWPEPNVILKGLNHSGVTLHKLSEKLDEGDIILQKKFDVESDENLETLTEKSKKYAVEVLNEFLKNVNICLGNPVKQPFGEYWPEPSIDDMSFDINDSYTKINTITRAFYGFCCYFNTGNEIIKIKRAKCYKTEFANKENDCISYSINGGVLIVLDLA